MRAVGGQKSESEKVLQRMQRMGTEDAVSDSRRRDTGKGTGNRDKDTAREQLGHRHNLTA